MTSRFDQPFLHESRTGARLNCRHLAPKGKARAVIIIAHGLAEHSGRYSRFAEAMAARGFAVYAHDHRGHGATLAADAPFAQFADRLGWQAVLDDVKAVRDLAATRYPSRPVVLFGHSMGGLIALNAAISHPRAFAAIAVWNANFEGGLAGRLAKAILRVERALKGSDVPSAILPKLTFERWGKAIENRRTMFDWLSHDKGEVDAYLADPLCGFDPTVSMWRDVLKLVFRGGDPRQRRRLPRDLPIHLLGGRDDPESDYGKAVERLAGRLRAEGFSAVTLSVLDGFRHETLNETRAMEAIEAFGDWVEQAVLR